MTKNEGGDHIILQKWGGMTEMGGVDKEVTNFLTKAKQSYKLNMYSYFKVHIQKHSRKIHLVIN